MPRADENITKLAWEDVSLRGISWIEEGRDMALHVLLPPNDRSATLYCRWARSVSLGLRLPPDAMGYALTTSGSVVLVDADTWRVSLGFGSAGELSLECSSVELEYASPDNAGGNDGAQNEG